VHDVETGVTKTLDQSLDAAILCKNALHQVYDGGRLLTLLSLLPLTRAGDEGLRSVLTVGATAVIKQALRGGSASPWLIKLLARKPPKLAAVALANKTARIAWKLMVTGQSYAIDTKPAATVGAV
jgi:hypothetical protein